MLSLVRAHFIGLSMVLMVSLVACDSEDAAIGTPCETTDDCPGNLICDIHEGQGSCQIDHSHGGGGVSTDNTVETGGGTTNHEALCTELCSCLEMQCSSFDGYPFTSEASCLTVCNANFATDVLPCYVAFCAEVPYSGQGALHQCEHAWGSESDIECSA